MSDIGIRPFGNKVIVERVENEKKGSLILKGTNSEDGRFVKGIILAVGDPIPNIVGLMIEPKLNKGDVVLYNFYNATPISVPGVTKKLDSVPYHEILAIFEGTIEVVADEDLIPSDRRKENGSFH
jgi:co-chaperonin GroES (HSP10)